MSQRVVRSRLCGLSPVCFLFFFFQAEDGIRDYKVTGVQTCALPIFCIRWLPEERMANTIAESQISPYAPRILDVVFELVIHDVRGEVEGALRERAYAPQQEVRPRLLKIRRSRRDTVSVEREGCCVVATGVF